MMATAIGQSPDDSKKLLGARLAELQGFQSAAREELKDAGGIDPELKLELRKLEEAIRSVNLQIFLAQGKQIKRGKPDAREVCPCCKRKRPA